MLIVSDLEQGKRSAKGRSRQPSEHLPHAVVDDQIGLAFHGRHVPVDEQQLMDDIWGYDSESDTHTVDVHIGRLRDRFRENQDFKIVTMRGVGYKVVKL